jgi:hypothetical protein
LALDRTFSRNGRKNALGTLEFLLDLFAARASVYGMQNIDEFLAYGPRMPLQTRGFDVFDALRAFQVEPRDYLESAPTKPSKLVGCQSAFWLASSKQPIWALISLAHWRTSTDNDSISTRLG